MFNWITGPSFLDTSSESIKASSPGDQPSVIKTTIDANKGQVAKVIGILPGIGVYSDSDDSNSSSSDSEIDTNVFQPAIPKGLGKALQAAAHQQ